MKASFVPLFLALGLACSSTALAQSSRSGIGAIPYADANGTGVTFRTWAPNATTVNVRGAFNGWGTTALAKDMPGGVWNGHWSADVSRAKVGDEYKFELNGSWRKDPRGKRVVNSAGNSVVYDGNAFQWSQASLAFNRIWRNDLVIYQMHVGSYNAESWLPSTFDQCIDKIPYIKSLGFSAVKLLPINEFPGDRSWGYNPSDVYAVESSFGGPDALKRFVQACHENGIAVILDVVHNHYGPSDLGDGMWQYDGWSQNNLGGIYFYNDWKAATDWGHTRPDFGRAEVRSFIKDHIRLFLEEYRVDGFRWDSVYNIRHASGQWNQIGSDMLWEINNMMESEFGYAFRIAEDHAFDTDVKFEAEWDHSFLDAMRWFVVAQNDADRNMNTLAWHLANGGFNRVRYVESHDTCGDLNNKYRLPRDVDSGNPQSYWAKKRSLLGHGIVLLAPGIPMIFAGSEMHEDWTFSNNTALRWSLTNQNAGIVRAFADLVHLRRNFGGVSGGLKQPGNVHVHHVDNAAKVLAMVRWDQGGQTDDLLVAINASATARHGYNVAFPSPGTWYCLYNSDSQSYDASFGGVGPEIGGSIAVSGANGSLNLGAYSIQIYSKSRPAQGAAVAFDPPAPSGCGTVLNVSYIPHDGPLAGATQVFAFVGRNNWLDATNLPMVFADGTWALAHPIPELTYELNFSFTDGIDAWDNNGGADWRVPVSNCGDLPAQASWSPYVPQGCEIVTFTYKPNGGPLMGASNVFIHLGRNGWLDVRQLPLSPAGPNEWTLAADIPDDTWELNFVFFDDADNWDNNNGRNWRVLVAGCVNVDAPHVAITNPAPATVVSAGATNQPLWGRARLLAGQLRWTNQLNGASGAIAYATNWHVPRVPLAEGMNVVRILGSNSPVNPNNGAWDSPTNAAYNVAWVNGLNGGSGFLPWIVSGAGISSIAPSNTQGGQLSLGPRAWALQSDGGAFVQAIRPFSTALHPGDVVSFSFENGGIDGDPSSVGIAFQNRFDQRLAEIYFAGGSSNWVVNDLAWRETGISWSPDPKLCTFELLTSLSYRLTVNGQIFEGEFADTSEALVTRIRFWNYNAGGGNERKFYVGPLSIAGPPLPVISYSSEIAVSRPASAQLHVEGFALSGNGFVATVNAASGIQSNIWFATSLVDGRWNWDLLPAGEYSVSNNVVTLLPAPGDPAMRLYSIGRPGGL